MLNIAIQKSGGVPTVLQCFVKNIKLYTASVKNLNVMCFPVQSQVYSLFRVRTRTKLERENLLIAKDESFGEIMIRLWTENNKDDSPE